jgi:hypothetical protein
MPEGPGARPTVLSCGDPVNGEFGKPDTSREITLCNTALFHSLDQLDRFAVALKLVLSARGTSITS